MVHDVMMERAAETAHVAPIWHFRSHVSAGHVANKLIFRLEANLAYSAHELKPFLQMVFFEMSLHSEWSFEVPKTILALAQVRQVNGTEAIPLHVKTQVLHEFNIVHKNFLAYVTFEGHIRLEFTGQDLEM